MKYEIYSDLTVIDDFSIIEFISLGKRGSIPKRIVFDKTDTKNVYNLAFGDVLDNGEIDDSKTSNNGDRDKILATVVAVVFDYTKKYPDRYVIFRGSTVQRTRLYRIAITKNYDELSLTFEIYGYLHGKVVPFSSSINMEAFLVKRKIV